MNLTELSDRLARDRRRVVEHAVYRYLDHPGALRIFMEHHVWAVWDFMSLLTRLQRDLTCVSVPWVPTNVPPEVRRFVNEIKLGEESDTSPLGGWTSHFELYTAAMEEVGADPSAVLKMIEVVKDRAGGVVVEVPDIGPPGAGAFVRTTLSIVRDGDTIDVAAAFALGREQLIPDLFRPIIRRLGGAPLLADYLARHVELDEGEHGPLAERLVTHLADHHPRGWECAEQSARVSLRARARLWDSVLRAIGDARLPSAP